MEMTDSVGDTMSVETDEGKPPGRLRTKHSSNLPALLERLGILHVQTTIHAGKLDLRRAEGDMVNTDFSGFRRPAVPVDAPARLAPGTFPEMFPFRNMTPICRCLGPPGRHNACPLCRASRVNGRLLATHCFAGAVHDLSAFAVLPCSRHAALVQEDPDKLLANAYDLPSSAPARSSETLRRAGVAAGIVATNQDPFVIPSLMSVRTFTGSLFDPLAAPIPTKLFIHRRKSSS